MHKGERDIAFYPELYLNRDWNINLWSEWTINQKIIWFPDPLDARAQQCYISARHLKICNINLKYCYEMD